MSPAARRVLRRALASGVCLFWMAPEAAFAQAVDQPRWLIEAPTAGVLPNKAVALDVRFYGGEGLLADVSTSLWHRVLIGVSFGGQGLLGHGDADWNPKPGAGLRVRVLDETRGRPAFAVGFRSQGFGAYDETLNRYDTKSLGFYGVFSKNYRNPVGQGGVHFGVNRSLEDGDGDDDLTIFVGVDAEVAKRVWLAAEYHFAWNDDGNRSVGTGRGYLNTALRWAIGGRLALELDLKNLLENAGAPNPDREVRVIYVTGI